MANFPRRKSQKRIPLLPRARRLAKNKGLNEFDAGMDGTDEVLRPTLRRRSIYLLPNAFTTAALFCGFYAIVMAMNQKFDYASVAIFAAMVLDAVDGRVARLTHTQSEFGAQYDSLSDMVSFGAAPALVVYVWALRGLGEVGWGKLGWLVAFIYCACAALRLARFNTNIGVVDKRYFQGLPSPAAAALVAGFVWLMDDLGVPRNDLSWIACGITLYAGLTMVTNVPFYSFKDVNFRKSVPFIAVFIVVLAFVAVSSDPPKVLFGMFCVYGLSGYGVYFWRLAKGKPVSIVQTKPETHIVPPDEK
ncbi:CDP-diacylglycerol--serine O-phosphatidyltransferase [Paucimonas lemoignei]|uniref:CDP-diacylglycerol--serine O-phosphatidyltransferase n=1 Tax=Paucimonas lemoignei TaxID=29443 RepID=A0A4R3I6C6_PAULE|nr:CDP-diacylglycerol--serine O-phosphatidyltransferase [Paucimonas lemoignei]TCS39599.1 CDP-diacylglycerol--serine O-phosphatidyltransferase [Paucimonas lemoignei]